MYGQVPIPNIILFHWSYYMTHILEITMADVDHEIS